MSPHSLPRSLLRRGWPPWRGRQAGSQQPGDRRGGAVRFRHQPLVGTRHPKTAGELPEAAGRHPEGRALRAGYGNDRRLRQRQVLFHKQHPAGPQPAEQRSQQRQIDVADVDDQIVFASGVVAGIEVAFDPADRQRAGALGPPPKRNRRYVHGFHRPAPLGEKHRVAAGAASHVQGSAGWRQQRFALRQKSAWMRPRPIRAGGVALVPLGAIRSALGPGRRPRCRNMRQASTPMPMPTATSTTPSPSGSQPKARQSARAMPIVPRPAPARAINWPTMRTPSGRGGAGAGSADACRGGAWSVAPSARRTRRQASHMPAPHSASAANGMTIAPMVMAALYRCAGLDDGSASMVDLRGMWANVQSQSATALASTPRSSAGSLVASPWK